MLLTCFIILCQRVRLCADLGMCVSVMYAEVHTLCL